jgi:hypothetical protein
MFIRLFILILSQTIPIVREDFPHNGNTISISIRNVTIEGKDTKGPYKLPDLFIQEGSEIVEKGGILLKSEEDYLIKETSGSIFFLFPLKKGETVSVSYRFFPFQLKREYKTRSIDTFLMGMPVKKEENQETKEGKKFSQSRIVIGGAKTFSIGINSTSGFSFDQSLKVNITGEITQGLSIQGVLSDENTPLQPEGTTESLEELDRIYVSIESKNVGATLGDYQLKFATPSTPIIERDLLGLTGGFTTESYRINGAFGIPRGKFHSLHLNGIEGKQGPYQLLSSEGEEDIVIVAGSETVYLDGSLLTRGEKNDYTINYSLAQVTFTSRRIITNESDIVITYQYTRIGFRRSVYSVNAQYDLSEYTVGGFYIRDSDEISQTEGFQLTQTQRDLLSQIGDDDTRNWVESGVYVGDDKGEYTFVDSFYVYQGYNNGDWNVLFSYIGEGQGDYIYNDSLSGFEYVGTDNGNYTSRIRISLPERENLAGVTFGVEKERISLRSELLGSDYDRNILSSIHDTDNRGFLTNLSSTLNILKSRVGELNILGQYRFRNDDFAPISRIDLPNFEDRWSVSSTQGREEMKNGGAEYRVENLFLTKTSISYLSRENIEAQLLENQFSLRRKNIPTVDLSSNTVVIKGDSLLKGVKKRGVSVMYGFWKLTPKLYSRQEIWNENPKRRWLEGGGELGIPLFSRSKCSFGYSKRYDDVLIGGENSYELKSRTTTKSFGFETEETNLFRGNVNIAMREKVFTPQFPGINTDLIMIESYSWFVPIKRKVEIESNYSITGKNTVLFSEIFYEVEEGTGEYSKDSNTGQYFPDSLGNYKRKVVRVGEGNPVTGLKAYSRLSIRPIKSVRFHLTASVLEENRSDDKLAIYLIDIRKFLDDSLTVVGTQSLDGNLAISPHNLTSLSYSFNFQKGLHNEIVSQGKKNYTDRNEFRIEQQLTKVNRLALTYRRERKREESIVNGLEKSEKAVEYSPEYSHTILKNFEVKLEAKTGTISIEEPLWYSHLGLISIKKESITPFIEYTHRNSAILNGSFTLTHHTSPLTQDVLPYDVLSFYPPGITTDWKTVLTISVTRMFSMNLSYSGINRPDKKTIHSAHAELRADF